jgi:hypothetical protein
MPGTHRAAAGDHLSRIAKTYGFRGYRPLWDDVANEGLRQARHTPHILAVGDIVTVPPMELRLVDRSTDSRHQFRAHLPKLKVAVAFRNLDGGTEDVSGLTAAVDGIETPPKSAGAGAVELPVGPFSDRIAFTVAGRRVECRVGFLEPADTVAGFRERLSNLGYRAGDAADERDLALRSAVEEFQCDHGLTVDGVCGPATQQALVKAHGC